MPDGNQGKTPGPPSGSQGPDGRAGYLTPDEQAQRELERVTGALFPNPAAIVTAVGNVAEDVGVNVSVAGGGFKMDIDAMKRLQPRWQAIAQKLSSMQAGAQQLLTLNPPAGDPGSLKQIEAARDHAKAYNDSIAQQWEYAQGYANQLEKAINAYEQQDQAHSERLRKQG